MDSIQSHLLDNQFSSEGDTLDHIVELLHKQQLKTWPMLKGHNSTLAQIEKREIVFDGFKVIIQHNPNRKRSTCANIKAETIATRPCFLCSENLPDEQKGVLWGKNYIILANPYPIFDRHFTIADIGHKPQLLSTRLGDMLSLAKDLQNYSILYNGPECGASAPDHFHFQALKKGEMPIDNDVDALLKENGERIVSEEDKQVTILRKYLRNCFVLESRWKEPIEYYISELTNLLPCSDTSPEPMFNFIASYNNDCYRLIFFPRSSHRPSCYSAEGDSKLIVSPASVELGGVIITPREEDFQKITAADIQNIYREVMLSDSDFNQLIKHFTQSILKQ